MFRRKLIVVLLYIPSSLHSVHDHFLSTRTVCAIHGINAIPNITVIRRKLNNASNNTLELKE